MSRLRNIKRRTQRRVFRIRNKQVSRGVKARISVFRSLKHIYAQIVDDTQQKTLMSFSSLNLEKVTGNKRAVAHQVGLELGKLALNKELKDVFFDRGRYLYHGRIKELAEGLREAGLKF